MRNGLSVLFVLLAGTLSASCFLGGKNSSPPDGGFAGFGARIDSGGYGGTGGCVYGGAKYGQPGACAIGAGGTGGTGGAVAASCNNVLFDNGNTAACTLPTDTSKFTLSVASTVTSLRLWTNTNISGQSIAYTLLSPTGSTLAAGPTTKGGCDPYQKNWCEFLVSMNMTLPAGTYTVRSSAVATCSNSGSNNIGFVAVKGCPASSPLPDAGATGCDTTVFDNGNTAACTLPTDTSLFTLLSATTVTSLRLWTNTTLSGPSISYTLLGPTGSTISAGTTTKGACDPYQKNWCEFLVSMNMTLPAGTYTVKSSAVATCSNSGSKSIGFVAVKGCPATSPVPDAGAIGCNTTVFDNGNLAACTIPTDTSVFTLSSTTTVTSLRLWTNTTISGPSVSYALLGPAGTTLGAGPTTKGACDPYQKNWCEFLVSMNMTLPAGTYTVKSSAVATCSNSGSKNIGFVAVKGCGSADAGVVIGTTNDRSCDSSASCIDHLSYPAGYDWSSEQGTCATMLGTWNTSHCAGKYCESCTWVGGNIITHNKACSADLQTLCAQGGGTYTLY